MRHFLNKTAFAALACAFPMAAWADIDNVTVTLTANTAYSFDSGAVVASGGDVLWTGSQMNFVGKAAGGTLTALGVSGQSGYAGVTQAILTELAGFATNTPIPASALTVGTVVGLGTNGGNSTKFLVTAVSGTSITIEFTTFGNTGTPTSPAAPTIVGITNNYSYIPTGFANSGIAPSAIFVIFGTNMANAPAGTLTLNSSAGPTGLPTTDAGATLTVSAGGNNYHPAMYYASPSQIAGVLPAGVPVGPATISVNFGGANSNAFSFNVVANALGLDTYYGSGAGLVTATDATTGALVTYTNSAKPMQILTFWGSGNGADPLDSDTIFTTTPHSVNQGSTAFYIGGVAASVLYAGSSGYPGLNQINVQVPSSVTSGCANSAVAVTNGVTSNFGFLPVAQAGGVCNDVYSGISGNLINTLGGQATVKSGTLFLGQLNTPSTGLLNVAEAMFQSTTGSGYGSSNGITSVGSCSVTETLSANNSTSTGLDAGAVSVTGPAGNYPLTKMTTGSYLAQLPANAITSTGGAFTFNIGGGTNVGATTDTINLPNPLLNWTNSAAAATVTRSQGLSVTWTGGQPGSVVVILGNSSSSTTGAFGNYTCYAPQSALQFTVPSYVTGTLPAGSGMTSVENVTDYSLFAATGLDVGIGFGFTSVQVNSVYQ
jgi:uncharacterized protein (TIGR03437 family)